MSKKIWTNKEKKKKKKKKKFDKKYKSGWKKENKTNTANTSITIKARKKKTQEIYSKCVGLIRGCCLSVSHQGSS
jgi:hypothetical protein